MNERMAAGNGKKTEAALPKLPGAGMTEGPVAILRAQQELKEAVVGGDAVKARAALGNGASPNYVYDDGRTALIKASLRGHTAVMEELLGAGAKTDIKDRDGYTAYSIALAVHEPRSIAFLEMHWVKE